MIELAALLVIGFILLWCFFAGLFLPLVWKSLPKDAAERDARKAKTDA